MGSLHLSPEGRQVYGVIAAVDPIWQPLFLPINREDQARFAMAARLLVLQLGDGSPLGIVLWRPVAVTVGDQQHINIRRRHISQTANQRPLIKSRVFLHAIHVVARLLQRGLERGAVALQVDEGGGDVDRWLSLGVGHRRQLVMCGFPQHSASGREAAPHQAAGSAHPLLGTLSGSFAGSSWSPAPSPALGTALDGPWPGARYLVGSSAPPRVEHRPLVLRGVPVSTGSDPLAGGAVPRTRRLPRCGSP